MEFDLCTLLQSSRVAGCMPLAGGVVKVNVHVEAVGVPVGDGVGPVIELGVRVATVVRLPGSVQADVDEIRRHCAVRRAVAEVVDAERGVVGPEGVVGLLVEPGRIAKLEDVSVRVVKRFQKVVEALQVLVPVGRALEEEGTERVAERLHAAVQVLHRLLGILQFLEVRDVLVGLDREREPLRGALPPGAEGVGLGALVERVVDLDGVERAGVDTEPVVLGDIVGVEAAGEGVVLPAGGADVEEGHGSVGVESVGVESVDVWTFGGAESAVGGRSYSGGNWRAGE